MTQRWSWKQWQQAIIAAQITDADALRLAEQWPVFAKTRQHGRRHIWAHEMTYEVLSGWSMSRVMRAANVLEQSGFSSRCPGTPVYVPTMPEATNGA